MVGLLGSELMSARIAISLAAYWKPKGMCIPCLCERGEGETP